MFRLIKNTSNLEDEVAIWLRQTDPTQSLINKILATFRRDAKGFTLTAIHVRNPIPLCSCLGSFCLPLSAEAFQLASKL